MGLNFLIVAIVIIAALIAGVLYLTLRKVSEETPEGSPQGPIAKADVLEQDET